MRHRVLLVVASSRGGGAAHVSDLATALPRDRFEVEVAMPLDGGQVDAADLTGAGVPCHRLALHQGVSPGTSLRLRALLRGFDLVHAHGARAAFQVRLAAAGLGSRRPAMAYTIHGFAAPRRPQPRRTLALAAERSIARHCEAVIAVCEAERRAYLAHCDVDPGRVSAIVNGVDADRFIDRFHSPGHQRVASRAELGVPADALLVVTACRLDVPRDFPTLLDAFAILAASQPQARLLIAGDGPLRGEIERLAARAHIRELVTIAGWRRDLPALLAASDVFALTADGWEGLPLGVLEAMASGLPVVATDEGGVSEAVLDGETGWLVPPRRPDALAAALIRLAEGDQRASLGRRGRERVAEHFPLRRTVDRIADLYTRLLASRPAAP